MSTTATETTQAKQSVLQLRPETSSADNDIISNLHQIPTFTDKYAEREWAKGQMAAAFRLWAKLGFNDGAGGHISLRDPVDPTCFWINPYAMHFGMIRASDLVLVNDDGKPMLPTPHKVNRAGFMIHSALHAARPDVNAACHTHSPGARAWSTFGKPIEFITQDNCRFLNDLAVYEGFGGVVLAKEEGENIAKALGPTKKNIILQNHGILTSGGTIGEAVGWFVALERACENQIRVEAAAANGLPKQYIGQAEVEYTKKGSGTAAAMYMQFVPEYNALLRETNGDFLL